MDPEKLGLKQSGGTKGWVLLFAGKPDVTTQIAGELARRRYDLLLVCILPLAKPWQAIRESFAWQGLACEILADHPAIYSTWLEKILSENRGQVQAWIDLSPTLADSAGSSLLPHKKILENLVDV